jgi:hypothetical protein
MTGATTMQLGLHALWLMALSAGGNSSVHVHAWRPYAPVCGPLRLAAGFCSGPAGLGLGGVTARACWRRPRTRQIAPTMAAGGSEDQWMFVDAKGLQKGAKALREIEVGVIARAFGDDLGGRLPHRLQAARPRAPGSVGNHATERAVSSRRRLGA